MLQVIVDEVGRHEGALQPVRQRRARVAQRIVGLAHHGMLGDVADARDHHVPGHQRQQPQQRIGPPHAGRRQTREQQRVDDDLRAELGPEVRRRAAVAASPVAERHCAAAPCAARSPVRPVMSRQNLRL